MSRYRFYQKIIVKVMITVIILSCCLPVQAGTGDELHQMSTTFGETGYASPVDILYQEDFEDGDLATSDPELINGLTWTANGSLGTGTVKEYDSKMIRMDAGAYLLSSQVINESEYTVSFTMINWYNTAARVMVSYQDDSNYYSFSPTTGQVYRMLDGVEEGLDNSGEKRLLRAWSGTPSINAYKIYFKNDGNSITISIDRDGYTNGKDYEFTYTDTGAAAVNRFKSGKIKLARVDDYESRYWVNFDDILVTKGKLQAVLPRNPVKLYVSNTGDDSFDGTETRPFRTIQKAVNASYPGDEIIVEDGLYEDPIQFAQSRVYSEEGNRLIIKSRNRHKAIINGINLKNGDYVVLDGFEVINESINFGESTGAEVINNYVHDVGIGILARGTNGRAAGNYIYKCGSGINVYGTNMLIENNEIERLIYRAGDSDFIRFFGEGHIIRGNYMHGTRKEEVGPAHVDGFQTFDNNKDYARHIIIEGNFVEDFYHQGLMGSSVTLYHSYDITLRNNVFKDADAWGVCAVSLRDVKVYNNLFINMRQFGVGFRGSEGMVSTGDVRNNIFYDGAYGHFGDEYSEYSASNNLIFSTDIYKKYDQDKFPKDIVNVDPLFMDVDNNDFSLHPNSPAIDKGMNLNFGHDFAGNTRPYGSSFDIGPFEYQGSNLPIANIKFITVTNKASGYAPFKVEFDGSSSYVPEGRSIVAYEWDFGDGSTGSGVIASHVFGAGKHTVKLTVTDNTGSKHTASRVFDVLPSEYPNLYLYLPFDTDCLDASGKGMTVNSSENILFENTVYGRSIRFNNDKSRAISVDHSNYLDGTDELTIAFFAKKDAKNGAASVIFKYNVYTVDLTADGFAGYIATNSGKTNFKVAKIVDDTQWHHYAVTYDGSNIVMYLDGNECSRVVCTGKIKRDTTRRIDIGRNPWNVSIEGLMDEIRIYDRALSKEEIEKIMEGTSQVTPSPTPTQSPSPTPTKKPSPTPTKKPNPSESGSGGGSTSEPTKKPTPTPKTTKLLSPTPKPSQDGNTESIPPDEDLITTDYPEMVRLLEMLYENANIRDNTLNPSYGFMMRREPVVTLSAGYQDNLRDLAKLTFQDIRGDEWYASHIPLAVYRKFVKGFPGGTFEGSNQVTRAEVLTMLARFNSSEGMIKQKAEKDAETWIRLAEQIGNDWYTHYVVAAKEGLVYPDLYTRETILQPMTRGEVIYALANFLWSEDIREGGKYYIFAENNETPAFNDTLKTIYISNPDAGNDGEKCYCWYKQLIKATQNPENGVPTDFYPSIICLKDKGILLGNNGDSKWNAPITRAEVLALFERLAKVWGEESKQKSE
ncbi:MAG: DUF1565 domain-containing protein [Clostridiaceae bacterium]|nr:DUF1565 domain-containing protein [Clostridiaceae bacterium]